MAGVKTGRVRLCRMAAMSEEANRKLPTMNTLLLFALYTNSESHNAQRYRRTDDMQIANLRSDKNGDFLGDSVLILTAYARGDVSGLIKLMNREYYVFLTNRSSIIGSIRTYRTKKTDETTSLITDEAIKITTSAVYTKQRQSLTVDTVSKRSV